MEQTSLNSVQPSTVQQPAPAPTQPAQTQPVAEEKSKWWIWVIVGIFVLVILAGIYFWLF